MEITYRHISSNKLPKDIMKSLDLLEVLNDDLRTVLESELELGNLISDVYSGFPDKDSIRVSLNNPFHKKYSLNSLSYYEEKDPHHNSAEYSSGFPVNFISAPLS